MTKFAYNNIKIACPSYILLKFRCDYHLKDMFKEDKNLYLRSCSIIKLAEELKELIKVCC